MRNLKTPSELKSKPAKEQSYSHKCSGLAGLNSYYAFSTKGLLKIINEFVDPKCKGHYREGVFYLSTDLSKEELLDRLTDSYKPSFFIPSYSKSFQSGIHDGQLEEIKSKYPEYYEAAMSAKSSVSNWLEKKKYKVEDIKGDVLVSLYHDLPSITDQKEVIEYFQASAIPYTITTKQGKTIKKLWYSPLFNKSLGRYGKGSIFKSYLNAIRGVDRNSWEACIFGTPHKVSGDYPLYQFDLRNWGGQREGKTDKKNNYSKGYGVTSGEKSIGVAADVLLLIASLTFFRGYLGETYINEKSSNNIKIRKKPIFTLCVRNTAPSFHTGLWCEMATAKDNPHLMGVEELFVPIWGTPMTFTQAKECLAETAELPIETYLNSKKDLMRHLSLHAQRTSINSYIRFSCVGRGGTGIAKLNFLIPVEEFDPKKSRRNDIVLPFNSLFNECLYKYRSGELPYTLHSSVEPFINSINDFSMSRSTPKEIMFSFLGVVDAIATSPYDSGNLLSAKKLKGENFKIPEWWLGVLERDEESSEMRIAKSISHNKQLCDFSDLVLLLEGKLDTALLSGYIRFMEFVEIGELKEISSESAQWLPIDFLVHFKFASYKKYDFSDQKSVWEFMLENNDSFGALGVALECLYRFNLISAFIYPFATTEKKDLEIALSIPFGDKDLRRLRNQIK